MSYSLSPPPHAGLPLPLTLPPPCRPPSPSHLLPMQASLSLSPPPRSPCRPPSPSHLLPDPHAGLPLPLTFSPCRPPPPPPLGNITLSFFLTNIMMWQVAQKPLLSMVSSHYTSFIIIINCSIVLPLHPLALAGKLIIEKVREGCIYCCRINCIS